jgi:biopolymer transport protein ExbB
MPKWFIEGGIVMYPLLLCSIVSVAIILERFYTLGRTKKETDSFIKKVKKTVMQGEVEKALSICDGTDVPVSFIFKAGILKYNLPKEEIEKAIEDEGGHQIPRLEKFLGGLAIISNIAPLIGFLGTVTGLYNAFMSIVNMGGVSSSSVVAGGIAEALITTVAGLCIAIPTVVFHGYFVSFVNTLILNMEKESRDLIDALEKVKR